jgi:hypothetical protein
MPPKKLNKIKPTKAYATNDPPHYEEVIKRVEALATTMINEQISDWLVPKCPRCDGLLSQYCATQKLICLKCQDIYALGWCGKDK